MVDQVPTASADGAMSHESLDALTERYLGAFGHYPPVHRMPDDLAVEMIKAALKEGDPLDPEPFAGSGCNCG